MRTIIGSLLLFSAVHSAVQLPAESQAEKLLTRKTPLVIAHRGYSAQAPENTLPAFQLALKAQPALVELDYYH